MLIMPYLKGSGEQFDNLEDTSEGRSSAVSAAFRTALSQPNNLYADDET